MSEWENLQYFQVSPSIFVTRSLAIPLALTHTHTRAHAHALAPQKKQTSHLHDVSQA